MGHPEKLRSEFPRIRRENLQVFLPSVKTIEHPVDFPEIVHLYVLGKERVVFMTTNHYHALPRALVRRPKTWLSQGEKMFRCMGQSLLVMIIAHNLYLYTFVY